MRVDESFIGSLARNMHKSKSPEKIWGTGRAGSGKAVVMGLLDHHSRKMRLINVPDVKRETLQTHVRQ